MEIYPAWELQTLRLSLDKLASEGIRFTDWYTNCPVCSPARAALLKQVDTQVIQV